MQPLFLNYYLLLNINLNDPFIKVLLPLTGIVVVFMLSKYKYYYSFANDLKLRMPRLDHLLFWLVVALLSMFGSDYFMNWRGVFDFSPWRIQPLHVSILRVLAVCFLGPILEELIFRGLLFHRFSSLKRINKWLIAAILAAIWAAIHYTYSIPVIAVIFVEGLLLGSALIKSRSLVVPIVMHICWNLYAVW